MPITYLDEQQPQSPQGKITYLDVEPKSKPDVMGDIIGSGTGLGLAGAGAYGLYKTGLPQKIGRGFKTVGSGIANLSKATNPQKGSNFAKEIRQAFIQTHADKVNEFGGQLEQLATKNPTKTVSFADVTKDIVDNWDEFSPNTKAALRKTPILEKFLKTVDKGKVAGNPESVSLKATQDIINHLNTKVPANIRANNLDLLETINNIKGAQLEAFPEMEGVRANYRAFIEPYKQIKGHFKFNRLLNSIKNNFGGAEGQVAAEQILPKEVIKKMKGYRSAANMADLPGKLPFVGKMISGIGKTLSVYPMIGQALNLSQQMEEAKKKGFFTFDAMGNIVPLSKEDLAI